MDMPKAVPAPDTDKADSRQKLLVSSWIHLGPPDSASVEVRRTMPVFDSEGVEVGTVAAVVVDQATQATTHLLLGQLHPNLEYRLVPLTLIEWVNEEVVQLRIPSPDVNQLPRRATA